MSKRMKSDQIESNPEKLEELILCFAKKSVDDPSFGSTTLNKMLYVADFLAYAYHGTPITGATYQHLRKGPAPRELLPIREKMVEEGRLEIRSVEFHGKTQQRPIALDEPNHSVFSSAEQELCDYVLQKFQGIDARISSEWSHGSLGWLNTTDREEIPYHTIFMWRKEAVTKSDMDWANKRLEKLGVD